MADQHFADVKGWLAQLGQTVQPGASVKELPPPEPGTGAGVVVLDRVVKGVTPEYCVHGYATCVRCREMVWLGHETVRVVQSGEAYPMCLQCATKMIPRDHKPIGRVQDHLRKDGPHE